MKKLKQLLDLDVKALKTGWQDGVTQEKMRHIKKCGEWQVKRCQLEAGLGIDEQGMGEAVDLDTESESHHALSWVWMVPGEEGDTGQDMFDHLGHIEGTWLPSLHMLSLIHKEWQQFILNGAVHMLELSNGMNSDNL